MDEATLDIVLQRVTHLGQEQRCWKILAGAATAMLGLIVLLGVSGSKEADEIRGKRFTLLDQAGKIRAALEAAEDGSPTLTFLDRDGKSRLALGLWSDGRPILGFYTQDGKVRAGLMVSDDDNVILALADQERIRAELRVLANGTPELALSDENGQARIHLAVIPPTPGFYVVPKETTQPISASPVLTFYDSNGKSRAVFSVPVLGEPQLSFYDENDKLRVALTGSNLPSEDGPQLSLYDKDDNAGAVLSMSSGFPRLTLTGRDGKSEANLSVLMSPSLRLFDKENHLRAELSLDRYGEPAIELRDKPSRASTDDKARTPLDKIRSKLGQTRVVLGATELESTRTGSGGRRYDLHTNHREPPADGGCTMYSRPSYPSGYDRWNGSGRHERRKILTAFPDLEREDIHEPLRYAVEAGLEHYRTTTEFCSAILIEECWTAGADRLATILPFI